MKIKRIPIFLILGLWLIAMSGCQKKQSFSDIPQIGFLGMDLQFDSTQYASRAVLSISYQDGNGDIGLNPWDTLFPYQTGGAYYFNFVINYFEKQNGVFVAVTPLIPLSVRIPVLTPNDPGRAIQGFIENTMQMNPRPKHDTVMFQAFIYDRALHRSNTISTPEIVLRKR